MSTRAEQAWIVGDVVVRQIAEGGHDPGHPFHVSNGDMGLSRRAELLRLIKDSRPDHVVPVDSVCNCSYISPLMKGGPIQDFGLAGDGNRLLHPKERRISWPASALEAHLAELANGLTELHGLGIAHGDPALMNAYIREIDDESLAVWVDLNSVHPATPEGVAVDIAAFEVTCLFPALLDADQHSPSLFDDLMSIGLNAEAPLDSYSEALAAQRSDYSSKSARADLLESLGRADPLARADALGSVRRRVVGAMAPMYFLDQTTSDQNARFFLSALTHERARHRLVEEERTRLHGIRYEGEIASLHARIRDLTAEVERLSIAAEHAERADELAGLVDDLQADNIDLNRLRVELELGSAQLEHEIATLRNDLNDIYDSRAWRMVSSLRSLIAIPSKVGARVRRMRTSSGPLTEAPVDQDRQPRSEMPPVKIYPYLVSVIMPVYNKGATLRESVESVLTQTLTAVEIVLWDDHSTDEETLRVLDEIAQLPNVTLFRGANQGVVGARNSAIAFSRGRYICCLDPDDLIAPTYLEKAVALLESQPEFAIAYPWVRSIGDVDEFWETQDLDPALITTANHVPVCAVFRRDVFHETGGFSEEMQQGYEDWEFWVHAAELGFRGRSIPSYLFSYRFSLDTSQSRDAQARKSHPHLVDKIARLHPRLSESGIPLHRPTLRRPRPVGRELGPRRLPAGKGHPVVLTLPWFTVGGADRVVESLIRRWVHDGRTVVVFTTTPLAPGMTDRRTELSRLTPYTYHLPDFIPPDQWYEFVAGVVRGLDSPVLLNIGSPWFYSEVEQFRRDFPLLRIVDQQFNTIGHIEGNRKVANLIDLTIAAYDGLAEELVADRRESEVLPIYVGIDVTPPPSSDDIEYFRRQVELGPDERLVLYVGRLAEEKRPEWTVRLARELGADEARVVVVGDGPLREHLAAESESRRAVIWIPDLELVEHAIAAADVLVIPSVVEGIPLVAMEALALGTPVVATRVGGLPDMEGEPGVTLVDPDDFNGFVAAVHDILKRPPAVIELSDRFGLSRMLSRYGQALFPDEGGGDSTGPDERGGQPPGT